MNTDRKQGTVKMFGQKGYGFITPDGGEEGAKDIFVHWSDIEGDGFKKLEEGQRVEFNLVEEERGLRAKNVKKL